MQPRKPRDIAGTVATAPEEAILGVMEFLWATRPEGNQRTWVDGLIEQALRVSVPDGDYLDAGAEI